MKNQGSNAQVYCYTSKSVGESPEQGWVNPNLTNRPLRNVAAFPVHIENPDPVEYVGPSPTENPELFTQSVYGPLLKNLVRITVMNADDTIIREAVSNPIIPLVREGRVRIRKNEKIFTTQNLCWFDKTSVIPVGRLVYLLIELDPLGLIPGAYCNLFGVPARFYTGAVMHGDEVDLFESR